MRLRSDRQCEGFTGIVEWVGQIMLVWFYSNILIDSDSNYLIYRWLLVRRDKYQLQYILNTLFLIPEDSIRPAHN